MPKPTLENSGGIVEHVLEIQIAGIEVNSCHDVVFLTSKFLTRDIEASIAGFASNRIAT